MLVIYYEATFILMISFQFTLFVSGFMRIHKYHVHLHNGILITVKLMKIKNPDYPVQKIAIIFLRIIRVLIFKQFVFDNPWEKLVRGTLSSRLSYLRKIILKR